MKTLAGKRVLITRPQQANDSLQVLLAAQGAQIVVFPTIVLLPDASGLARLDEALQHLGQYDWVVFTSQKAVGLFCERWKGVRNGEPLPKIAAIGPVTARAVTENGLPEPVIPDEYIGDAIPDSMGDVQGQKVLVPRAQAAREALVNILAQRGAEVEEISLYQTVTNQPEPAAWQELEQGMDYITFTSASTVHSFCELLGERAQPVLEGAVTACIGPVTAEALKEHGLPAQVIARQHTAEGLVQAMIEDAERNHQEANV